MDKKIIIITGASSGIGAAAANEFYHNEQYQVVLLARNLEAMQSLGLKNAELFSVDVTQPKQVTDIIKKVVAKYHKIDCLINSAGIAVAGNYEDCEDTNNLTIDVNVNGVINTINAVLPIMQQQKKWYNFELELCG